MNSAELMYALQCCAPTAKVERDCASCPFSLSDDCHNKLCNAVIGYIISTEGKHERVHNYIVEFIDGLDDIL